MATLIKAGDTVINLDVMTQAYFKPGSVRLYFAVAVGKVNEMHLDVVEFFGRDAEGLQAYFEENSIDVLALYAPPEE